MDGSQAQQMRSFKRYSVIGIALIALLIGFQFYNSKGDVAGIAAPQPDGPTMGASKPLRVMIPKLGIDAATSELGLKEDKALEVPDKPDVVGWYKLSPTPGELGPAVMVGHLDWYESQKAVFYDLGKLEAGDEVRILRQDGSIALFKVTGKEVYNQDDFQSEKVYGRINHAGLRLITCTGDFLGSQGHYRENLVVYAQLIGSQD